MLQFEINEDRISGILRDDEKVLLNVLTPSFTGSVEGAVTRLGVHSNLDSEAVLKQFGEIVTQMSEIESFIHVDAEETVSICDGATVYVIQYVLGENSQASLQEALDKAGVNASHYNAALVQIVGKTDLGLQTAAGAVQTINETLVEDSPVIWGLALDDVYEGIEVKAILAEK